MLRRSNLMETVPLCPGICLPCFAVLDADSGCDCGGTVTRSLCCCCIIVAKHVGSVDLRKGMVKVERLHHTLAEP